MDTVDVLREARELIAVPDRWCQGASARDDRGKPVHWSNPLARQFCATGAVNRVQPMAFPSPPMRALHMAAYLITGTVGIHILNDEGSHAKVLEAFDHAIATEATL